MIVYCATNTVNGKRYVGVCARGSLAKRQNEHKWRSAAGKFAFANAIRKHGWDAFEWQILERCDSRDALATAEQKWIQHFDCMVHRNGYNQNAGGLGNVRHEVSAEARQKMSHALRGREKSAYTRALLSAARKGKPMPCARKGTKHRPESIERMRAAKVGKRYSMSEQGKLGHKKRAQKIAKIKDEDVPSIRARRDAGEKLWSIATTYQCSDVCVSKALRRT